MAECGCSGADDQPHGKRESVSAVESVGKLHEGTDVVVIGFPMVRQACDLWSAISGNRIKPDAVFGAGLVFGDEPEQKFEGGRPVWLLLVLQRIC